VIPSIQIGPIFRKGFTIARLKENAPDSRNLLGMDILKDYGCRFYFDDNKVTIECDDENDNRDAYQPLIMDKKFHPYIDIQFGNASVKAVWDTGSSITVVDINFIKKYPEFFEAAGQSEGTDSAGSTHQTPVFIMKNATIGKNRFPSHRVAGVDLTIVNTKAEFPFSLIAGYSTICKANWLFDFPRKKWSILKMSGEIVG
jgi:hypothetical protein